MDHFRRTKNLVITKVFARLMLGALDPGVGGTGDALLDGAILRFFTQEFQPTPDSVAGDITQWADLGDPGAALDGLSDPINIPGNAVAIHQEVEVVAGVAPTDETIRGYAILDGGGALIAAERYEVEDEVPIAEVGDFISHDFVFPIHTTTSTGLG